MWVCLAELFMHYIYALDKRYSYNFDMAKNHYLCNFSHNLWHPLPAHICKCDRGLGCLVSSHHLICLWRHFNAVWCSYFCTFLMCKIPAIFHFARYLPRACVNLIFTCQLASIQCKLQAFWPRPCPKLVITLLNRLPECF